MLAKHLAGSIPAPVTMPTLGMIYSQQRTTHTAMRYGKRTKEEMDRMSDSELYEAVEEGAFVDPSIVAYCKKHRPHVLMDRMLDHANDGGAIGAPGEKWMRENADNVTW